VVRLAKAALVCTLVTASAGCSAANPGPAPKAAQHTAAQTPDTVVRHRLGVLGSFRVGQHWLRFTEPAHRGVTGARLGSRNLLVQVLYPAAAKPSGAHPPASGPFPMIMFAPGFAECGGPYGRMLRSWASAGYVVVVVNFPMSDCKAGPAATESDMVNQPGDMSYVIDRMLALDAGGHGPFAGLIDRHAIAAAGQSDGGDTVAALAANGCCADRRVMAVAALSGAEWPPMPGRYFPRMPVPMLVTQGSADRINWPGCSVQLYRTDPARARYYLNLFGAGHTVPYWGVNRFERVVVRVGLAFFNRFALGQAAGAHAMQRAGDVPGVAVLYKFGAGHLAPGPCDN
jgi:dienelactone hydrolase